MREAPFEQTEHGLLLAGDGWFVLNARDAAWRECEGMGKWPRLEGATPRFEQFGFGLTVLEPGETMAMYHWETDQEDFLVLSGEALAIVEGEERALRQWDLLHCPPRTNHVIVGAGDGPCVVFAVGARMNHTYRKPDGSIDGRDDWGAYTVHEAALRHGAGVDEETNDGEVAYARFPERAITSYRTGWLPEEAQVERVRLAEITQDTRRAVLALRVAPEQEQFVGSVHRALEDATEYPHANPWYRAVYAGDEPVGFVMVSWNVEPKPPEIIGPWFLWKLLIDARYQGRGYGADVVRQIADLVRREGATELLTSYVEGSGGPAGFYERLGFVPTGERDDKGEVIVRLALS